MILLLRLIIKHLGIVVQLLGGGGINNIAFPHDVTSRAGFATALQQKPLPGTVTEMIRMNCMLKCTQNHPCWLEGGDLNARLNGLQTETASR
jgi:hypothetical protein